MSDRCVDMAFSRILGPVTYHAVARYLERVQGMDVARIKREITATGEADASDGPVVRWMVRTGAVDLEAVVAAILRPSVRIAVEMTGAGGREQIKTGRMRVVVMDGCVVTVARTHDRHKRPPLNTTRRRRDRLRREVADALVEMT